MDDQSLNPRDASPDATPPLPSRSPSTDDAAFHGRTPDRAPAIRAGALLGAALVLAVGAAVALGASPSTGPGNGATGAQPSAAASPAAGQPSNGSSEGGQGQRQFGPRGSAFGLGPLKGRADRLLDRLGLGARDGLHGGLFGPITVTAVSGSTISLSTEDGWTRTITVTATTKITKAGQPATLGDVKVGDVVRLAETRNADGTFSIAAVAIVQPATAGTVTAIDADTITITRRDRSTEIIRTTNATTYRVADAGSTRAAVTVGSTILATGDRAADGSLTATAIRVVPARILGTVTSVSADSITVKRRDGSTATVHVGPATSIAVPGVSAAKLTDVKPGMALIAIGQQRADGSIDAGSIRAGQPGRLHAGDRPDGSGGSAAPSPGNG
jgi:preprotein translocase subunit YajC